MRIVIAVHTYHPDKNGVQIVTQYIAEGLAENNQVMVITEKKPNTSEKETLNQVQINRIDVKTKGHHFSGDRRRYYRLLKEWNPDIFVCVCTQTWTFDWIKNVLGKLPGKKVLYTHGYSGLLENYPIISDLLHFKLRAFIYHYYWKRYYDKAYEKIVQFDLVTYLSTNNNAYQYAVKHKINNSIIMENAVEDIFYENPVTGRIKENQKDKIWYLYVANYDNNKNHKMVLNAFYNTNIINAGLILAGKGEKEYFNQLEEQCQENEKKFGKKSVNIMYGQTREETYELYDKADVFVCGSKKEQFPVMLCEAAAKGMAVVSTNVGHASLMPGIFLVETMEDMQKAMEWLYDNPEERRERGRQLRRFAIEHYRRQEKINFFEEELKKL